MKTPLSDISSDIKTEENCVLTTETVCMNNVNYSLCDKIFQETSSKQTWVDKDQTFKIILKKLYIAYKYLTPVIREIISSTSTHTVSELQTLGHDDSHICSVTQKQYTAAINAAVLIQEIIQNNKYLNDLLNSKILQIATDDLMEIVQKPTCLSTKSDYFGNCGSILKICIKKRLANQFIKLYKLLYWVLQQLDEVAKCKQAPFETTKNILVKSNHNLKSNSSAEQLNLADDINQPDNFQRLAKLEEEYRGLSDTLRILKSVIQKTSTDSIDGSVYSKNSKKVKSINFVTEPNMIKKITDVSGARLCILECLSELADVRKQIKNSDVLSIANKIQLLNYSKRECCKRQDVPHLHAKLNGTAVVLKLNKETVDIILSPVEIYSRYDKSEYNGNTQNIKKCNYLYSKILLILKLIIQSTSISSNSIHSSSIIREEGSETTHVAENTRFYIGDYRTTIHKLNITNAMFKSLHNNKKILEQYSFTKRFLKTSFLSPVPKFRVFVKIENTNAYAFQSKHDICNQLSKHRCFPQKSFSHHSIENVKNGAPRKLNILRRKPLYLVNLHKENIFEDTLQRVSFNKSMKMCVNIKRSISLPEQNTGIHSINNFTRNNTHKFHLIGYSTAEAMQQKNSQLNNKFLKELKNIYRESNIGCVLIPEEQIKMKIFDCIPSNLTIIPCRRALNSEVFASRSKVTELNYALDMISDFDLEKRDTKALRESKKTEHLTNVILESKNNMLTHYRTDATNALLSNNDCNSTKHVGTGKHNSMQVGYISRWKNSNNFNYIDLMHLPFIAIGLDATTKETNKYFNNNMNLKCNSTYKTYCSKLDYYADLLQKCFKRNFRGTYEVRYFELKGALTKNDPVQDSSDEDDDEDDNLDIARNRTINSNQATYVAKSKYYNYPDDDNREAGASNVSLNRGDLISGAARGEHGANNPLASQPWAPFVTSDISLPRIPLSNQTGEDQYSATDAASIGNRSIKGKSKKPSNKTDEDQYSGLDAASTDKRMWPKKDKESKFTQCTFPTGSKQKDPRAVKYQSTNCGEQCSVACESQSHEQFGSFKNVGVSRGMGQDVPNMCAMGTNRFNFELNQKDPRAVKHQSTNCKRQCSVSRESQSHEQYGSFKNLGVSRGVGQDIPNRCDMGTNRFNFELNQKDPRAVQHQSTNCGQQCSVSRESQSYGQFGIAEKRSRFSQASSLCVCNKEKQDSYTQATVEMPKESQSFKQHCCSEAIQTIGCPQDAHVRSKDTICTSDKKKISKHNNSSQTVTACTINHHKQYQQQCQHQQQHPHQQQYLHQQWHQHLQQHQYKQQYQCQQQHQYQHQHQHQHPHQHQQQHQQQQQLHHNSCNKVKFPNKEEKFQDQKQHQNFHKASYGQKNNMQIMHVYCKTYQQMKSPINKKFAKSNESSSPKQYCLYDMNENGLLCDTNKTSSRNLKISITKNNKCSGSNTGHEEAEECKITSSDDVFQDIIQKQNQAEIEMNGSNSNIITFNHKAEKKSDTKLINPATSYKYLLQNENQNTGQQSSSIKMHTQDKIGKDINDSNPNSFNRVTVNQSGNTSVTAVTSYRRLQKAQQNKILVASSIRNENTDQQSKSSLTTGSIKSENSCQQGIGSVTGLIRNINIGKRNQDSVTSLIINQFTGQYNRGSITGSNRTQNSHQQGRNLIPGRIKNQNIGLQDNISVSGSIRNHNISQLDTRLIKGSIKYTNIGQQDTGSIKGSIRPKNIGKKDTDSMKGSIRFHNCGQQYTDSITGSSRTQNNNHHQGRGSITRLIKNQNRNIDRRFSPLKTHTQRRIQKQNQAVSSNLRIISATRSSIVDEADDTNTKNFNEQIGKQSNFNIDTDMEINSKRYLYNGRKDNNSVIEHITNQNIDGRPRQAKINTQGKIKNQKQGIPNFLNNNSPTKTVIVEEISATGDALNFSKQTEEQSDAKIAIQKSPQRHLYNNNSVTQPINNQHTDQQSSSVKMHTKEIPKQKQTVASFLNSVAITKPPCKIRASKIKSTTAERIQIKVSSIRDFQGQTENQSNTNQANYQQPSKVKICRQCAPVGINEHYEQQSDTDQCSSVGTDGNYDEYNIQITNQANYEEPSKIKICTPCTSVGINTDDEHIIQIINEATDQQPYKIKICESGACVEKQSNTEQANHKIKICRPYSSVGIGTNDGYDEHTIDVTKVTKVLLHESSTQTCLPVKIMAKASNVTETNTFCDGDVNKTISKDPKLQKYLNPFRLPTRGKKHARVPLQYICDDNNNSSSTCAKEPQVKYCAMPNKQYNGRDLKSIFGENSQFVYGVLLSNQKCLEHFNVPPPFEFNRVPCKPHLPPAFCTFNTIPVETKTSVSPWQSTMSIFGQEKLGTSDDDT